MKRNAIVRIVIWSIVLLLLVSFLVTAIAYRSLRFRFWNSEEQTDTPMHTLSSQEGGVSSHPL